ncbi:MAG: hypothetical protein HYT27_00795 [Parcubacteria group bacterium]|nr:hypothetical protein [Parcubacteria group bacterium]
MYKKNNKEWFLTIKARRGDESLPIEWYYFKQCSATFTGDRSKIMQIRNDVERLSKEDFFKKYHDNPSKDVCVPYKNSGGEHLTWFTFNKIKKMLQNAGFSDIRRSSFLQSISEEMRAPEFDTRKGKLKGDTRQKVSCYIDVVR